MKILIVGLLILSSCTNKIKNCGLIGKWKSVEFNSSKSVDFNKDGTYSKNLLKEDDCTEVIFNFMSNGKVERYYKNRRTNCKLKKHIRLYCR